RRIKRNRRQALLPARWRIDEIGPALCAVIVAADILALEIDPMDHTGLQIGDQKLLVPAIVGNIAERCAGIRPSLERDGGKQTRLITICGVKAVDGARTAGAEHAG